MEHLKLHKHILCIDLKSFYASVECALLGYDPFETPLVVADPTRGGGSIVLAVTPYLKSLGVPSRCRVHELPSHLNIIIQKPRMRTYLEYSIKVIEIYLKYISEEDLYIYSVDEVFLDVTSYLKLYKQTPYELAQTILNDILKTLHIHATCGIGPNMLIAKLALDIESKKAKNGIAQWHYDTLSQTLWPVSPLSQMWGIGHRMEKHLNRLGLYTVGDLASYNPQALKKRFGIIGEELYYHAHGIDLSLIQDQKILRQHHKSFGMNQTLFKDYYAPDVFIVIKEMIDDISRRLRHHQKRAYVIALGIGYSKAYGGGFHRQMKLDQPTDLTSVIFETCIQLFNSFDLGFPIRRVSMSVSNFASHNMHQYDLFANMDALIKEHQVSLVLDHIHKTHGHHVYRATSLLDASTTKSRHHMVGGHHG